MLKILMSPIFLSFTLPFHLLFFAINNFFIFIFNILPVCITAGQPLLKHRNIEIDIVQTLYFLLKGDIYIYIYVFS